MKLQNKPRRSPTDCVSGSPAASRNRGYRCRKINMKQVFLRACTDGGAAEALIGSLVAGQPRQLTTSSLVSVSVFLAPSTTQLESSRKSEGFFGAVRPLKEAVNATTHSIVHIIKPVKSF